MESLCSHSDGATPSPSFLPSRRRPTLPFHSVFFCQKRGAELLELMETEKCRGRATWHEHSCGDGLIECVRAWIRGKKGEREKGKRSVADGPSLYMHSSTTWAELSSVCLGIILTNLLAPRTKFVPAPVRLLYHALPGSCFARCFANLISWPSSTYIHT